MRSRRRRTYRRTARPALPWQQVARHVFWAGCLTLVVGAVGTGGWFGYRTVLESGMLDVQEIDVFGAQRVGAELGSYLQLSERTSLLQVDVDRLADRLERHPWIRNAEVHKRYPNGLELRLAEREPALLHLTRNLYVADTEGQWVKRFEPDDGLDLPVVTGLSPRPVTAATETLRGLVDFVRFWDAPTGPVGIGEIHYAGPDAVWVYPLDGGPRLHLPLEASLWEQTRTRLERVLSEARQLGLELKVVDLLYPDRVIAQRKI